MPTRSTERSYSQPDHLDDRSISRVVFALQDQFTANQFATFLLRHTWSPGTEFHVIRVAEVPYVSWRNAQEVERATDKAHQWMSSMVHDFAELIRKMGSEYTVIEHVIVGNPADEIIRFARKKKVSMIVMGCRKRKTIARFLLGSVSSTVASDAPCSVVILKGT